MTTRDAGAEAAGPRTRAAARARAGALANAALRKGILVAAGSTVLQRFVSRYGMRLGAGRFVAGETLDEAVPVLRRLNDQGLRTNTTLLGESTTSREQAIEVVIAYEEVLDRIAAEQLQTNVALKLTHLGLELDAELAYENLERLVRHAAARGNFIRIDMEDSRWVDATLELYRRLRAAGHDNVGCVLQAYLYRSEADLEALLELRPNLRLVKGAYLEPETVAYPEKADVDDVYARMIERSLPAAAFTAVATHDQRMLDLALAVARREGLDNDRFELQMLYGVRSGLQQELAQRGLRVLVATPYGPEWYPYLMRRLAERPANVLFFLRSLVSR